MEKISTQRDQNYKNCQTVLYLTKFENSMYCLIKSKTQGISFNFLTKQILLRYNNGNGFINNNNMSTNPERVTERKCVEVLKRLVAMNLVIRVKTKSKYPGSKYYSTDNFLGPKRNVNCKAINKRKHRDESNNVLEHKKENSIFLKTDSISIKNNGRSGELLSEEMFDFDYEFIEVLKEVIFNFVHFNNLKKMEMAKSNIEVQYYINKDDEATLADASDITISTSTDEILVFLNAQKITNFRLKFTDICTLCDVLVYEDKLSEIQFRTYTIATTTGNSEYLNSRKTRTTTKSQIFFDKDLEFSKTEYDKSKVSTENGKFSIFDLPEADVMNSSMHAFDDNFTLFIQ